MRIRYLRRNPEPVYDDQYKKMVKKGGFKIKFTLKPENGEFTSEIQGIPGQGCHKVVENVTSEMGIVLDTTPTGEYFEKPKDEPKATIKETIRPSSGVEVPLQQMPTSVKISKKSIEKEKQAEKKRYLRRLKKNPGKLNRFRNPWKVNPGSYKRFNRFWY